MEKESKRVRDRIEWYRFFAEMFLWGPSRRSTNSAVERIALLSKEDVWNKTVLPCFQQVLTYSEKEWADLMDEYSRLFEGTENGCLLLLWESAFRDGGALLTETTWKVKDLYRQQGIGTAYSVHQPDDHIGLECAFMQWLSQSPNVMNYRMQLDFLANHLLPFSRFFCRKLAEKTEHPFFQILATFFPHFLQMDYEHLQKYPLHANAPTEKNACSLEMPRGLRKLFPKEYEAEPDRMVPVSGANNCGGRCLLYAHIRDGMVIRLATELRRLTANGEDISTCLRGKGYRSTFLSANRLRYPLLRVGERGEGQFARISWNEAIDFIADRTTEIRKKYGPASRYVNYATGINGIARGDSLARHLLALDGGYLGLYNSYSAACAEIATPYTYGTGMTGSTSDTLLDSKLIVLWGHNPMETVFGVSTRKDLLLAKKKGIKIVVVDPRYSDSAAALADQWIGIRPTTDSALIDAMAYVILTEGLHDQHFMDVYCLGFDRLHMPQGMEESENYIEYCMGYSDGVAKTPAWAEQITGITQDVIIRFAREFACSKPAALLPGFGYQRHGNGEQSVRSMTMRACLTGNVGVRGGNAAGVNLMQQHHVPTLDLAKNPVQISIPSFQWTEAVLRGTQLTEEDGVRGAQHLPAPIKMIFNLGGNTLVNQHSDIRRTIRILKDTSLCECIVCSDVFMTPSALFADLLLPGTSLFETCNITLPWHQGDYLLYNNAAISPLFESRFEYDWLSDVAQRMGIGRAFTGNHQILDAWLREAYEQCRKIETELPPFDDFAQRGGYQYQERTSIVAFEKQREDFEHHPFPTPSGKIEIASPRLSAMNRPDEIPAIPKYVPSFEGPADERRARFPMQLIGWHTKTRCHSIHFSNDRFDAVEKQELWINPQDACTRSIQDGNLVLVWNDRACVRLQAHVTQRIVKGVVAMAQGTWYHAGQDGIEENGSINALTTSRPTPLAKGNPQHSNLVEVKLDHTHR